jgi:tetratricopeptide (TPR) repeat protein
MTHKRHIALIVVGLLLVPLITQAQSAREQLNQLVQQLQSKPDDNGLREQIIKLAQQLTPSPAPPDEAERRMVRGAAAFKGAQSVVDYQDAAKEFAQAALAAPWYGDAYYNLGVAQDKAEQFDAALRNLKLAQLASPDSKEIKDLYYNVEYRRDKAAEQNSAMARQQAEERAAQIRADNVYRGLDGGVWVYREVRNHLQITLEVHGHEIESYWSDDYNQRRMDWHATFTNRHFQIPTSPNQSLPIDITISDDGQSITHAVASFQYVLKRIN